MNPYFLLLLLPFAMAYAWGMRGCILGGEKGAMLPGAVAGLLLARLSGIPALGENWFIPAAVGAAAFSMGGSMTYGETLGLTMNGRKTPGFARGMAGVFIKGFIWFGNAAAILGVVIVTLSGECYSSLDVVTTICAAVPLYIIGRALLNRPCHAETGKFPKLYFSKTRQECWGGGLFVLLAFILLAGVRKDSFTLGFTAVTAVFAACSWVVGQYLHVYSHRPMQSGRLLFGSLQEKGYIGGWKLMECLLGFAGGLGMAVGFLLFRSYLHFPLDGAALASLPLAKYDSVGLYIWLALFLLNALRVFIEPNPTARRFEQLYEQHELTEREYKQAARRLEKPLFLQKKRPLLREISEGVDYVLYGFLPPLLAVLGFASATGVVAVFALFWVLTDEICFDTFIYRSYRNAVRVVLIGLSAAILAVQLLRPEFFTAGLTTVLYFVSYELLQCLCDLRLFDFKRRVRENGSIAKAVLSYKSSFAMHCFFVPLCLLLDILGLTVL